MTCDPDRAPGAPPSAKIEHVTPRRLGPYELLAPLGSGGAGQVFRARHLGLGVERAVKVLSSTSGAAADRFAREARSLASVRHPNVVGVHETGVEPNGTRWLAMELVAGDPLDDVLTRGPLPLDRALEVLAQVARGVEALHAVGIVHRDLKPANVLLARDGRAVVVDLGLALAPDSDERLTKTGAWVGTAQYVAPEQLSGAAPSPRTDVHALGLLVYEVTTGLPAFDGQRSEQVLARVLSTSRPVPSELDLRLPAALDVLVRKAIAYEPAERFARAGEVADALEALRAAPGPSAGSVRSRRRLVEAGVALGLAVVALAVGLVLRDRVRLPGGGVAATTTSAPAPARPRPTATPPPPPPPTRRKPGDPTAVLVAGSGVAHAAWLADGRLATVAEKDAVLRVWALVPSGAAPAKPAVELALAPRTVGIVPGPAASTLIALAGETESGLPARLVQVDVVRGLVAPLGSDRIGATLGRTTDGVLLLAGGTQAELVALSGMRLHHFRAEALGSLDFRPAAASPELVAVASSRSGDASSSDASTLAVWRRKAPDEQPKVTISVTRITALAICPLEPTALLVGWASGSITRVRPLLDSEPEHLEARGSTVNGVAVLPSAHNIAVHALAFTPDGLRLATTAADYPGSPRSAELRWWRTQLAVAGAEPGLPTPIGELTPLTRNPATLAISPDGRWLAIGTTDGSVELRAAPE